jgi:hypothetical protein
MTSTVNKIEIPVVPRYHFTATSATGYLIENVLSPIEFDSLLKYWEQFHVHGLDWDQTVYYFKGKAHATANQRSFGTLYDRKIFDLTENPEWYYQTPETMVEWAKETMARKVHPRIVQIFEKLKTFPPLNECPDQWVVMRGLINVLIYKQLLTHHIDGDPAIFNAPQDKIREYSITIYLNEVSHGGEFWIDGDPGFVYKPVPNSAFIFPGGHILHGVNMNMDEQQRTRKAITFRVAHVDSLHLPGDPEQFVIKSPSLYTKVFEENAKRTAR